MKPFAPFTPQDGYYVGKQTGWNLRFTALSNEDSLSKNFLYVVADGAKGKEVNLYLQIKNSKLLIKE